VGNQHPKEEGMRVNSSRASLAISATALFVALGGTAVAVSQRVGTKQIANGAVTKAKLHNSAVSTSKLANGAVTSSKLHGSAVSTSKLANRAVTTSKLADQAVTTNQLADQSVTALKVAPNTFLPANGTAVNADRLGGQLPGDFVQGVGILSDRRVVVPAGGATPFLNTLFGTFTGNCDASGHMNVTWSPTVANAEFEATLVKFPGTTSLDTANAIPAGGAFNEPSAPVAGPLSITFQIGYTSGLDHVATAYVTGRFESGTGCVFIGQAVSTG
jgi:hypothetical protein